jgi:outer membrane protein assembly factor BamB
MMLGSSGKLYVAVTDQENDKGVRNAHFVCLEPSTGEEIWTTGTVRGIYQLGSVSSRAIYTFGDGIALLDPLAGRLLLNADPVVKSHARLDGVVDLIQAADHCYVLRKNPSGSVSLLKMEDSRFGWIADLDQATGFVRDVYNELPNRLPWLLVRQSDDVFCAIDPVGGLVKWRFTSNEGPLSVAIGQNSELYVASWAGDLTALDGRSGSRKWTCEVGYKSAFPPVVHQEDTVFVGSGPNLIQAIGTRTGRRKWKVSLGNGWMHPIAEYWPYCLPLGCHDGWLYVASTDKVIYRVKTD